MEKKKNQRTTKGGSRERGWRIEQNEGGATWKGDLVEGGTISEKPELPDYSRKLCWRKKKRSPGRPKQQPGISRTKTKGKGKTKKRDEVRAKRDGLRKIF